MSEEMELDQAFIEELCARLQNLEDQENVFPNTAPTASNTPTVPTTPTATAEQDEEDTAPTSVSSLSDFTPTPDSSDISVDINIPYIPRPNEYVDDIEPILTINHCMGILIVKGINPEMPIKDLLTMFKMIGPILHFMVRKVRDPDNGRDIKKNAVIIFKSKLDATVACITGLFFAYGDASITVVTAQSPVDLQENTMRLLGLYSYYSEHDICDNTLTREELRRACINFKKLLSYASA